MITLSGIVSINLNQNEKPLCVRSSQRGFSSTRPIIKFLLIYLLLLAGKDKIIKRQIDVCKQNLTAEQITIKYLQVFDIYKFLI